MTPKEREVYDNYMEIMTHLINHLANTRRYPLEEMVTANRRMLLTRSFVQHADSIRLSESDLEADYQILDLVTRMLADLDAAMQALLAKNKKND